MNIPPAPTRAYSATELIEGCHQYGAGNCVAIAAIKASLMAFGTRNVFESVTPGENAVTVKMRDGKQYELSFDEWEQARQQAAFKGDNRDLYERMVFMYAIMAKRAQVERNDELKDPTYAQALNSLSNGEDFWEGPIWLGINHYVINGPNRKRPNKKAKDFLRRQEAGIAKSPKHAWFSSKGKNDDHGEVETIKWTTSGGIAFDLDKVALLDG